MNEGESQLVPADSARRGLFADVGLALFYAKALALTGRAVWYDPVEIVQYCGTCCGNLDHDPSAPALVLPVSAHHPPRPEATAAPDHLKNRHPIPPHSTRIRS